jgi:hypothetical protein
MADDSGTLDQSTGGALNAAEQKAKSLSGEVKKGSWHVSWNCMPLTGEGFVAENAENGSENESPFVSIGSRDFGMLMGTGAGTAARVGSSMG